MVPKSLVSWGASALLTIAGLILPTVTQADDWQQFRRDASRSAASADKVKLPLTDVWTWSTRGPMGHTPLYHATVRRGKVYFTASESGYRHLICADLKSGQVTWRQKLDAERLKFAISDIAGPAVSDSGIVYVYDWVSGGGRFTRGQSSSSSGEVEALSSFTVRTFDAANGAPGPFFPLAAMGANGVLPRLSLTNTPEGQEVRPVPPTFVGCPP